MADLTRRGFLGRVSVTTAVGVAGGLGLGQLLSTRTTAGGSATQVQMPAVPAPALDVALDKVALAGPMIIHVRDVPTAEVSMMVGANEWIYRDPELVSRLVKSA